MTVIAPRKKLTERILDAVDLTIDFATLGEYGLEPVPVAPDSPPAPGCGGRLRSGHASRRMDLPLAQP